jgi:hypothetical protein
LHWVQLQLGKQCFGRGDALAVLGFPVGLDIDGLNISMSGHNGCAWLVSIFRILRYFSGLGG